MNQAQDLRDASPADLPEPGQLGVVADRAATDHLLETESQGHQAGDARYSARCHGRSLSRRRRRIRVPALPLPCERTFDDLHGHGLVSWVPSVRLDHFTVLQRQFLHVGLCTLVRAEMLGQSMAQVVGRGLGTRDYSSFVQLTNQRMVVSELV
jgi:hypothetical protein